MPFLSHLPHGFQCLFLSRTSKFGHRVIPIDRNDMFEKHTETMKTKLNDCPVCGGEAERHTCGPFGQDVWLKNVRCVKHCTRGAINDTWEEAEKDWNEKAQTPKP